MISELTINSKNVDVAAKVVEKRQPREVNTKFGRNLVAESVLEDQTGQIILVLWGDDIEKIKEGDSIKIKNGYITEWNGALQLNIGKFGTLEIL